jgi:hypothetical protein
LYSSIISWRVWPAPVRQAAISESQLEREEQPVAEKRAVSAS